MVTTNQTNEQPGEPSASPLVEQYEKQTFAIGHLVHHQLRSITACGALPRMMNHHL